MLKIRKVNKSNLEIAVAVHKAIFPKYNARQNFLDSFEASSIYRYYLIMDNNEKKYIGIFGIYSLEIDKDSAWLGWFGVLSAYRRKHYGSYMLHKFEEIAKKSGYKYCRLYTDFCEENIAISFYKKNGYSFENYINENDPSSFDFPLIIGSKSLWNNKITKWNNRNINLTSQIFKQLDFKIEKLHENDIDVLLEIYEDAFLDNKYFIELFEGKDLKKIMDSSFKKSFLYSINKGLTYGIFIGDCLVAFVIAFDYFDLKNNDLFEFNNLFTGDIENQDLPYLDEFHNKIIDMKKPVLYISAVCVERAKQGKGIASRLIDFIIITYNRYTIISDVTSPYLLKIFKKRKFETSLIDEDYYLVFKNYK